MPWREACQEAWSFRGRSCLGREAWHILDRSWKVCPSESQTAQEAYL